MNNNRMIYKIGGNNTEYYNLLKQLRPIMQYIPELSNGWFYVYNAEHNGNTYQVMNDVENGIPYSIEIL